MKISVTEKHIREGIPLDVNCCPIALAVRERFGLGDDDRVEVDSEIRILDDLLFPSTIHEADLPDQAGQFIERFDNQLAVEPFDFDCDLPDPDAPIEPQLTTDD